MVARILMDAIHGAAAPAGGADPMPKAAPKKQTTP
jgi:hypothetical protein